MSEYANIVKDFEMQGWILDTIDNLKIDTCSDETSRDSKKHIKQTLGDNETIFITANDLKRLKENMNKVDTYYLNRFKIEQSDYHCWSDSEWSKIADQLNMAVEQLNKAGKDTDGPSLYCKLFLEEHGKFTQDMEKYYYFD